MARRWRTTLAASAASAMLVGVGLITTIPAVAAPAVAPLSPGAYAVVDPCQPADENPEYQHDIQVATVSVAGTDEDCLRTYELDSGLLGPDIDRTFSEREGRPVVRTGSPMLDGMFALAVYEEGMLGVNTLQNWGYNNGFPMSCVIDGVGCYNTGEGWGFVWTRDVSYSADLGISSMDPIRMRNSLLFKISERRDVDGGTQIIQDTGTGGSYPNSTDRVTWALGAQAVLPWLKDEDRAEFAAQTYEAVSNTVDHDRGVVYNPKTGLYMGETSFLDWRQQTYAEWTARDVTDITESESLSTNINHYNAIKLASELAMANGNVATAAKYQIWAASLLQSMRDTFWLEDRGQFSSFVPSELNRAVSEKYDALATSLAVLYGIATPEQAAAAIVNYPQTPYGPPVIWPAQQEDTRHYHNKGIWPFVTAYMLKAAAEVDNDQAVTAQVDSMIRQAAMFATNWENMSMMNGGVDGMALNNRRQTWSVSGTIGMFQEVLFGVKAVEDGLVVDPYLPAQVRNEYFPGREAVSYNNLDFRGKLVDVVLELPAAVDDLGAYVVDSIAVDGTNHPVGEVIPFESLGDHSVVTVKLGLPTGTTQGPKVIATDDTGDGDVILPYAGHEAIFAPKTPTVSNVKPTTDGEGMTFNIGLREETPAAITMDVIRDGKIIAEGLDAATTWTDSEAKNSDKVSYCYSVRLKYRSSSNASQDADSECYWGTEFDRVLKVKPNDTDRFILEGTGVGDDKPVIDKSQNRVENWGTGDDHRITAIFNPTVTGRYLVQTEYSLGYDIQTDVTSALKLATVYDVTDDERVAVGEGVVVMPHTNSWSIAKGSTFVDVELKSGHEYHVVLENDLENDRTINMSYFEHNAKYNSTRDHFRNKANIYEVKLLLKDAGEEIVPAEPTLSEDGLLTVPDLTGVVYTVTVNGSDVVPTDGVVKLRPGESAKVIAEPADGFRFPDGAETSWSFDFVKTVVPEEPVLSSSNVLTIPRVDGVHYMVRVDGRIVVVVGGDLQLRQGQTAEVTATPRAGYAIAEGSTTAWTFKIDDVPSVELEVLRLSGPNRFATNLEVNRHTSEANKPLFVATGASFADALAAGPAVSSVDGSLALTSKTLLTADLEAFIKEKKPSEVYVIGGTNAVSSAVVMQLEAASGKSVERIFGADRYATSTAIFDRFFAGKTLDGVLVATGRSYPDALSASAAGGSLNRPVVLVDGKKATDLPPSVVNTLADANSKHAVIVGGTNAVSSVLESSLQAKDFTTKRLSGASRYETNMAVNQYVDTLAAEKTSVWVATGGAFPDALSASVPAGDPDKRLVLSNGKCLPKPVVSEWINGAESKVTNVTLVGGVKALADSVFQLTECK